MHSIGKILVRPFGGGKTDRLAKKADGGRHTASAPTLRMGASLHPKFKGKVMPPKDMPKWLEHELMQEKFAEQAHEDWRRDVAYRLMQIRQKPRLNTALNVLVYQLKRENLTEGQLFEKIDSNQDGELSRTELQAALRKLGVSLSTSELDGILRIFDSDGSGSIDFTEFYQLIKNQEDFLPEDFGLDDDQPPEDSLQNYHQGERVKLRLCMSNKALHVGEHDDPKSLHGTIVGPGPRKDTYLLKLEDSDQNLLVKPRHMSKAKSTTSSKSSSRLVRNRTVELV